MDRIEPVQSPGALPDWVKPLALLAMTVDHINTILLASAMRPLWDFGRISFPLFALLAGWNLAFRSRSPARYVARLGAWAVVSTPFYEATFGPTTLRLNPLFALALGVLVAWACLARPAVRAPLLAALVLCAASERWSGTSLISFGTTGALLVVALALWLREPSRLHAGLTWCAATLLNVRLSLPPQNLDAAAICIATLLVAGWATRRNSPLKRTVPPSWLRRHGFYLYYPAHLLVLLLVWNWLNVW